MSATICPACNKPLPAAVVGGPPQAVVRCEGCQTLLLWSNGRVMRSARSSTGTMMGMPAVTGPKKDAEPPLPALKPEADAAPQPPKTPPPKPAPPRTPPPRTATQPLARVQPAKVPVTGVGDNVPTRVAAPPPELLQRDEPQKAPPPKPTPAPPAKATPAPTAAPPPKPTPQAKPMANAPSKPMGASPSKPIAVSPSKPIAVSPSKPMAVSPSKPNPLPPAKPMAVSASKPNPLPPPATAATAAPPAPAPPAVASEDPNKPQALVAAVAEVPSMGGGPMVDPSAWFSGGGDTGDVPLPEKLPAPPVIESSKPPRSDSTGAAPLPPPPELQPLKPIDIAAPGSELTPALGMVMPEMRASDKSSAPIKVDKQPSAPIKIDKQPSAPIKVAPTTPARKDPTPPPKPTPATAQPRTTMLGIASPTREPPKAQPAKPEPPKAQPARPEPAKTPAPASAPMASDDEVPIEIAEDQTPPRPLQSMLESEPEPAPFPSSATSLTPPPTAPPGKAQANAPTLVSEREISALPPSPFDSEAAPSTPMAGESVAQPDEPRGPRFVLPQISRRVMAIGGAAAAALLIIVLAVALTRGPKRATPPTKNVPATQAPKPVAEVAPPAPPTPAPAPTAPAAVEPTPPATPPSGEAEAPPQPPRQRRTLGGKKVVLEYDPKPTAPTPPPAQAPVPMGEDPATVARAREAYHKGNVKLFSGDTEGAIALYRESIKIYPGYVAGYRGLGLGYEAAGNPEEALKAFHTYVKTVPNANDSPIIRRRIEHLEGQKSGATPE